ncbi:A alpha-helical domain with a conserved ER moti [Bosea sp. WAO]|uniref:alpha-E domain-containing protein n=1 Tax=Bosea sp. WAO TaxID=406341 RepID=UPI000749E7C2|nr:alpha-E domain-containing protein [Bosea sp. WAO]KUL97461.1 A alpha-helical domain with a conserved ER moti [Bosea sp. WAO]
MLSRTADSLYWVSRYVERAEYLARILDATTRLTNLPSAYGGAGTEWQSAVATAGCEDAFALAYDEANERNVCEFLTFNPDNPSSIRNCFALARSNARAVRTALTSEMWDALNSAWLELQRFERQRMDREEFARFLDWVKNVSLVFDGSAYRTMLRDDGYWFSRLGVHVERADNTARILDVKYHLLLPETEQVGGSLDYFQWTTMLREVSALTAYHWVYREAVKPVLIADLLILNKRMPRSLASCYESISRFLDQIGDAYDRHGPAQRQARKTLASLANMRIDAVIQRGLHEFIEDFITENNRLGAIIVDQYLQ